MVKPEFEEKSYENAFNAELEAGNQWRTFSPGQVAEANLGVDVLARMSKGHPFWKSVQLTHKAGARHALTSVPDEVFNVFLQYKTSHHLVGARARHHVHFRGPYYRFRTHRPSSQLSTLQQLESHVGTTGYVRYVAPEFHTLAQLRAAQGDRRVIAESVAVPPSAFGVAHRAYNFRTGKGAVFNPDREFARVFTAHETFNFEERSVRVAPFRIAVQNAFEGLDANFEGEEFWNGMREDVDSALDERRVPTESREFLMAAAATALLGMRWLCVAP